MDTIPAQTRSNDAQQSIRLVRAYAKEWNIDPNKIGIMGFSAGAELASAAAVLYDDFDKKNSDPGDPLAGISSRPDFVGIIYPGPTPFARNRAAPPIPRNVPPSFIASGGSDDQIHAIWADEYFAAMLAVRVPNLEMHIYANGSHPGDLLRDGSRMSGGLTDRSGIPFGTWQFRFIDWFRDLGFLEPPGVETKAAKDIAFYLSQPATMSVEPPAGVTLLLAASGDGAQVYTCTEGHWTLKAPDAKLLDDHGQVIGTHFAGPTWRLNDGSEVKGKMIASRPASDGSSVPSLLLQAVPGSGTGKLADVTYIGRTDTHGGAADEQTMHQRRTASALQGKLQFLHRQTVTNIHPVAAEGFQAGAAAYVAGRPDYPPEIEAWLTQDLGLSKGKTALDLAAGTGKFSPGCWRRARPLSP